MSNILYYIKADLSKSRRIHPPQVGTLSIIKKPLRNIVSDQRQPTARYDKLLSSLAEKRNKDFLTNTLQPLKYGQFTILYVEK